MRLAKDKNAKCLYCGQRADWDVDEVVLKSPEPNESGVQIVISLMWCHNKECQRKLGFGVRVKGDSVEAIDKDLAERLLRIYLMNNEP